VLEIRYTARKRRCTGRGSGAISRALSTHSLFLSPSLPQIGWGGDDLIAFRVTELATATPPTPLVAPTIVAPLASPPFRAFIVVGLLPNRVNERFKLKVRCGRRAQSVLLRRRDVDGDEGEVTMEERVNSATCGLRRHWRDIPVRSPKVPQASWRLPKDWLAVVAVECHAGEEEEVIALAKHALAHLAYSSARQTLSLKARVAPMTPQRELLSFPSRTSGVARRNERPQLTGITFAAAFGIGRSFNSF
jgi:hypothetical protein